MSVFDHLWQSTLVAVVVIILTLLFRNNSARVRHALWLTASLKFLLPFSLLAALGRMAFVQPVPAQSFAVLTRMRPVAMPFSAVAPEHLPWFTLVTIVWALGAAAIAGIWLLRWHRLSIIARNGQINPGQILGGDPSGADIHVPDFGIAELAFGQAHSQTIGA